MLISLYAEGFRSLKEFHLVLHKGINALVGPNGAGKSNILACFDFIGDIIGSPLPIAVRRAGGIEAVFSKLPTGHPSKLKSRVAEFRVSGVLFYPTEPNDIDYEYEYSFRIKLKNQNLIFSSQGFKIWNGIGKKRILVLDVRQKGETDKHEVRRLVVDKIGPVAITKKSESDLAAAVADQLTKSEWSEASLVSRLSNLFHVVYLISRDIPQSEPLYIDPEVLRNGDDIGIAPELSSDGEGVIRFLYGLQSENLPGRNKLWCRTTYEAILSDVKVAVESLKDIKIELDQVTGRHHLVLMIVGESGSTVEVPARLASDGTLKWLALVTFLRAVGVFSLEEPENYLHPLMQRELVRLMREHCDDIDRYRILITTHSETLINALKPAELLLVSMRDGITVAASLSNAETLQEEINNTGFGLGHYYLAGATESED